jgi:hypothetical protein
LLATILTSDYLDSKGGIEKTKKFHESLNKLGESLDLAKSTAVILLHHDAITGTHNSMVNNDYKKMIASVKEMLRAATETTMDEVKTKDKADPAFP